MKQSSHSSVKEKIKGKLGGRFYLSYSEEKERKLTIKDWYKDMGINRDEFMLLVDICLEEREEVQDLEKKQRLLNSLEQIYIRETHTDERVKKLCLIAKELYIRLLAMEGSDVVYIMKRIINAKEFIDGIGGLLDSFWQENEVTGIDDSVIQNVCRARHLAYLQISV